MTEKISLHIRYVPAWAVEFYVNYFEVINSTFGQNKKPLDLAILPDVFGCQACYLRGTGSNFTTSELVETSNMPEDIIDRHIVCCIHNCMPGNKREIEPPCESKFGGINIWGKFRRAEIEKY